MQKSIMPGRTKEEQKKLNLRQQRIYDFLKNNHVGVLASVDPNGDPHAAVVYYVVDERFVLSFITRAGTKKHDNLIRNNHVVMVIFEPKNQTVAQVIGKAVEIKNANKMNAVAEAVFESVLETEDKDMLPITKVDAGEYTAFKIEPDQIRLAAYARRGSQEEQDAGGIFEAIESFDLNVE